MKNALDFIIIGAQKAGTTSLFEYLRRHPELSLPSGKEVPFFSHEPARARGWDDYMRNAFALADPNSKWGTATPQYMVGGLWDQLNPVPGGEPFDERTVPMRIRERAPDVRLIAILRDPVERAQSHHRMTRMNDLDKRQFSDAVDDLLRPEALEQARREPRETTGYVTWGEYGRILAAYFDIFRREQMLVLFTEELENAPEQLLRRIYEFLDVQVDLLPDNVGVRYRVGGSERRFSWLGTNSPLNPWTIQRAVARNSASRGLWHSLPEARRHQIARVFARGAYSMDLWNRRTQADPADANHATLEKLRAHYAEDTRLLTALLRMQPPWHMP